MLKKYADIDDEVSFFVYETKAGKANKISKLMSELMGYDFMEVDYKHEEDVSYDFPTDTIIIKYNIVSDDILDLVEKGVEIHIIK